MSSWAFRLLLLAAPFFAYRFAAPGANVTLFRCALFLVIGGVLIDHFTRFREGALTDARPAGPLLVPLWLFLLYGIFQTTRSEYDIGLRNLLVLVEGVITVTAIVWHVRDAREFRGLVMAFAAGAVLPSLIGAYQVYGVLLTSSIPPLPLTGLLDPWLVPYDPDMYGGIHLHVIGGLVFPRVASTLVDANFFGIYVASVILCVVGLTAGLFLSGQRRRITMLLYTAAGAAGLLVLLFTMSRSAWLGLAVGALYFAYHATRHQKEAARARIAIALVGSVCVLLVWQVIVLTRLDLPILAMSRAQDLAGGMATRNEFAAAAVEAFSENPLFGVGRANLIGFIGYPTAHSYFLTRLAEDGLVGLCLSLAWLLVIWGRSAALLADDVDPETRWAAIGLRSAFLALLVANIPYDHLISTEVNWVLLGLVCASGRIAPNAREAA